MKPKALRRQYKYDMSWMKRSLKRFYIWEGRKACRKLIDEIYDNPENVQRLIKLGE